MLLEEFKEVLNKENVSFEDFRLICEDAIKEIEKRDQQIIDLKNKKPIGIVLESDEQRNLILSLIDSVQMKGTIRQLREAAEPVYQLIHSIQKAEIIDTSTLS